MKFNLYIKSPVLDYPDYDETIEANSKEDAVNHFYKQFEQGGWTKNTLSEYVREIDMEDRNDDSAKYEMGDKDLWKDLVFQMIIKINVKSVQLISLKL